MLPLLAAAVLIAVAACDMPEAAGLLLPTGGAEKFQSGDTVVIAAGQALPHDLYVAAGVVEVAGAVDGDLVAIGGTVTVTGTVADDVLATGGSVEISGSFPGDLTAGGGNVVVAGDIGDDVRIGGGSVELRGAVRGDLLVAGGSVWLRNTSRAAGDVVLAGGTVSLDGELAGGATITAGEVTVNGTVGGDLAIAAERVVLAAEANITGNLTYVSPHPALVETGARVLGTVEHIPTRTRVWWLRVPSTGATRLLARVVAALQWALGAALLGLALLWLAPRPAVAALEVLTAEPWRSFGVGVAVLLATPLVVVLVGAALVVIGLQPAWSGGVGLMVAPSAFYVALLVMAGPLAATFIGALILSRGKRPAASAPEQAPAQLWAPLLLGTAVLAIAGALPVVRTVVASIAAMFGLGAWALAGARALRVSNGQ